MSAVGGHHHRGRRAADRRPGGRPARARGCAPQPGRLSEGGPVAASGAVRRRLPGVADGGAGWGGVGGATSLAPGHPVVVGSADGGRHWTAEDSAADFTGNDLVTASVAAGRAGGYTIVGWQARGG